MQTPCNCHLNGFIRLYIWAAKLLYHPFAWAYDTVAWLVSFGYWPQWRRDAMNYLLPGLILETGFGTGALLVEMVQGGYDVIGLEPSKQMHQAARRKLARHGVRAKLLMGRTQHLPFLDKAFDSVLSTFPTNYIFDPKTQSDVLRVLKLGGRWIIVGIGVRFKSAVLNWLVGWILGKKQRQWLQNFTRSVRKVGFDVFIIDHQTEAYCLPLLMLERNDA